MTYQNEIESAKDAALRLLTFCPRSIKEISDRLREKGFSKEAIEKSIIRLKEIGYLDDLKFTKNWINSSLEKNPVSIKVIKEQLISKGIDGKTIEEALLDLKEVLDEYRMAKRLLAKRLEVLGDLDQVKVLKKAYPYLKRRGFSDEVIERVLREKFDIEM
ncbi:MAG: regulatory protein RecX [Candidatus Omnitrophica bacterium]|nr:regulatory protein RecX [Candidatus Omnitrophota bacterium]